MIRFDQTPKDVNVAGQDADVDVDITAQTVGNLDVNVAANALGALDTDAVTATAKQQYYCNEDGAWENVASSEGILQFHLANIAAAQDFIIIDKSDVTTFPHASASGHIHVVGWDVAVVPDAAYVGEISFGVLDDVTETTGDYIPVWFWPFARKSQIALSSGTAPISPWVMAVDKIASTNKSVADAAFGSTDLLWCLSDMVAAYSVGCGDGDLVCRITLTAGSMDVAGTLRYRVE